MHTAIFNHTKKNKQYCTEIVMFQTRHFVSRSNKKSGHDTQRSLRKHDISILTMTAFLEIIFSFIRKTKANFSIFFFSRYVIV